MRRLVTLALALACAATVSGCGVRLRAEQVILRLGDNTITVAKPAGRPIRAGEVVVTIENYTFAERQVVLARTDTPVGALPSTLVNAKRARDHDDIVAVSGELKKARREIVGLVPVTLPSTQRLHVHLHDGERYLLFDRANGLAEGYVLELRADA